MSTRPVFPPPPVRPRGMAAFAHPASAQKSEHELLVRSKRLLEDKLRALQVRDPHTHRSMHGHQGCPVPPQAEEADLRAKLDECAKQAPGEEALLMIGHLPPSRPRGQGVAELQEVPPSVDAVATPRPAVDHACFPQSLLLHSGTSTGPPNRCDASADGAAAGA